MNYKNNGLRELQELSKQYPDYTLGEVLYASLKLTGAKKIQDLLEKTDEEIFTAINKAIEVEHDTPIEDATTV